MLLVILGTSLPGDGIAMTPPMGWITWEQFRAETDCKNHPTSCINADLLKAQIDALVSGGYLAAGYDHINVDDAWPQGTTRKNNVLVADPDRFPDGIPGVVKYAHDRGVKFGIYLDLGTKTCGGYTGTEGYEFLDAQTIAEWGVDMMKFDGCNAPENVWRDGFLAMGFFLNSTGRKILYAPGWPAYDGEANYTQLTLCAHMWRNYGDVRSTWSAIIDIINHYASHPEWIKYAGNSLGTGNWFDPDMLMIGMTKNSWVNPITNQEERSQMSLWSILAAPLMMSNDLRNVRESSAEILLNGEVIAIDQDIGGKMGWRVSTGQGQVWVKPLANGDWAVALLNDGGATRDISVDFSLFAGDVKTFKIRDLWAHKDLGSFTSSFTTSVASHDTALLRLSV